MAETLSWTRVRIWAGCWWSCDCPGRGG